MKTFQQFINEAHQKLDERYKPLPVGRMDRRAARTAATGVGHLGIAGAAIGAENAVGEVGDLPDEIARRSIERSVRPLERSSKIIRTRLTHSPERSQERERTNKQRGNKVTEDTEQTRKDLNAIARQDAASDKLAARRREAQKNPTERAKDLESKERERISTAKERAAHHAERQKSQPKNKEFRPLLNFRSDAPDFKFF